MTLHGTSGIGGRSKLDVGFAALILAMDTLGQRTALNKEVGDVGLGGGEGNALHTHTIAALQVASRSLEAPTATTTVITAATAIITSVVTSAVITVVSRRGVVGRVAGLVRRVAGARREVTARAVSRAAGGMRITTTTALGVQRRRT